MVKVESRPGGHDVYQVVGDIAIFIQILSGTDVHSAIDLTRVGGEDLPVAALVRQIHGIAGFPGGRRPEHDNQINGSGGIFIEYAPEVNVLWFRQWSRGRDGDCLPQLVLRFSAHPLVAEDFLKGEIGDMAERADEVHV